MAVITTPPIAIPAIAPVEMLLDDVTCEATAPIAVPEASDARLPLLMMPNTVLCEKERVLDDDV